MASRAGTHPLRADAHRDAREARIAAEFPLADAQALDELGISPDELAAIQRQLRGWIVLPGMPSYDKDRLGNIVYPETFAPQVIVYCVVAGDVRLALMLAHNLGLSPTCRSGAHSSAGFSVNNGLVIDVSNMNDVAVDPGNRRAMVGSGANLGLLNDKLAPFGLHVPGGTCNDVGTAGHMMGGGYGFTSRQYGMNCDVVVAVKMMLADGTVVEASESRNSDLLWAVRGGTGNQFGVLLDATYELAELDTLWGFCLQWDAAGSAAAIAALQAGYMREGASDLLGYLAVYATPDLKQPGLLVFGTYNGPRDEGLAELAPLREVGSPALTFDATDTYANLNARLLDLLPGIPPPPQGQGVYEAKQAGYIATPLGVDGWQQLLDYYDTSTPTPFNIVVIEPYGGAISRLPVADSAFIHRDVDMDFFVDSFWIGDPTGPGREQAESWLAGYFELVSPWLSGHVYQDYPWRALADYRWAYWGDAFPSLLRVKRKYDPDNFFAFEQSITPVPDGLRASSAPAREIDSQIERLRRPLPLGEQG